jgi:hypothetical protein
MLEPENRRLSRPKNRRQTTLKFETGIPIPPARTSEGNGPWAALEIGQSVLIPRRGRRAGSNMVHYLKKRYGFACKSRVVEGGVRIWRLS